MTMDRAGLAHAEPAAAAGADLDRTLSSHPSASACTALGIDVGSVNVKACGLAGASVRHAVVAHEGDVDSALARALAALGVDGSASPPALATGGGGRRRIDVPDVIAPRARPRRPVRPSASTSGR